MATRGHSGKVVGSPYVGRRRRGSEGQRRSRGNTCTSPGKRHREVRRLRLVLEISALRTALGCPQRRSMLCPQARKILLPWSGARAHDPPCSSMLRETQVESIRRKEMAGGCIIPFQAKLKRGSRSIRRGSVRSDTQDGSQHNTRESRVQRGILRQGQRSPNTWPVIGGLPKQLPKLRIDRHTDAARRMDVLGQ